MEAALLMLDVFLVILLVLQICRTDRAGQTDGLGLFAYKDEADE